MGGLSGYLVTTGFDEVTGLGSIDGANLVNNWVADSATTTTVTSSLNPANFGVPVTFTVTVTTEGSNLLNGLVSLVDGSTQIGTVALSMSGPAAFTISTLAGGSHSITAVYDGDANNAPSTSTVLTQTIGPPPFNWAANGSTSGTVLSGQTATYNFIATPTGASTFAANVTFACSGLPDATVTCNFNPTQINANAGKTPVQVTVTTSGPTTPTRDMRRRAGNQRSPWMLVMLPLAGVVIAGLMGRTISKYSAVGGVCASLAVLGLLVACGSSSGGGSGNPPLAVVAVSSGTPSSVFPNDAADDWPSQTAQFTATITNETNAAATWAVSPQNGGTIDANGLYTAPTAAAGLPANVTITATSVAAPTQSGSAQETLNGATVPGTYPNIMVTATENTIVNSVPVTLIVQQKILGNSFFSPLAHSRLPRNVRLRERVGPFACSLKWTHPLRKNIGPRRRQSP